MRHAQRRAGVAGGHLGARCAHRAVGDSRAHGAAEGATARRDLHFQVAAVGDPTPQRGSGRLGLGERGEAGGGQGQGEAQAVGRASGGTGGGESHCTQSPVAGAFRQGRFVSGLVRERAGHSAIQDSAGGGPESARNGAWTADHMLIVDDDPPSVSLVATCSRPAAASAPPPTARRCGGAGRPAASTWWCWT